jgi:osmotically-inducible protein OsmY
MMTFNKTLWPCLMAAVLGWGNLAAAPPGSDDVATRVKAALHSDPHVYDQHVDVSLKDGNVVLDGFVQTDWDLHSVVRIATSAAGGRKVVDNLTIKEGGK